MSMAVWHICGSDDPRIDNIVVWLMLERIDGYGRSCGIETVLAVYSRCRYRIVRTQVGIHDARSFGKNICWSYVIDRPKGPTMIYDGNRWVFGEYNSDYFKEEE